MTNKGKSKRKTQKREIRVAPAKQRFEIRKNADGSQSIAGQAVVYNTKSEDLGFREVIKPGAFTRSLRDNPDVLCLYAHDDGQILGRVASGTLSIRDTATALQFTCRLPDTSTARDLIALMERGDLHAMSFGFSVPDGGDEWAEVNGQIVRTVNTALIYEISVVGQPAYTSSSVSLRSCPASLRSKLPGLADDDDDPDCDPDSPDYDPDACEDDDDEDRCECRCDACGLPDVLYQRDC